MNSLGVTLGQALSVVQGGRTAYVVLQVCVQHLLRTAAGGRAGRVCPLCAPLEVVGPCVCADTLACVCACVHVCMRPCKRKGVCEYTCVRCLCVCVNLSVYVHTCVCVCAQAHAYSLPTRSAHAYSFESRSWGMGQVGTGVLRGEHTQSRNTKAYAKQLHELSPNFRPGPHV